MSKLFVVRQYHYLGGCIYADHSYALICAKSKSDAINFYLKDSVCLSWDKENEKFMEIDEDGGLSENKSVEWLGHIEDVDAFEIGTPIDGQEDGIVFDYHKEENEP